MTSNDKVIPDAKGKKTPDADFDRNRDGVYGGRPEARDGKTSAPKPPRASR